jgi:tRNA A-37 threonylcarbamoyl transferase component Bud32
MTADSFKKNAVISYHRKKEKYRKEGHKMIHEALTGKRTVKEARHKAYKVGGSWVNPMCFPFLKDNK